MRSRKCGPGCSSSRPASAAGSYTHGSLATDRLELLTLVWLLMIHHGLGDAAAEVKLFTTDDHSLPELGSLESDAGNNWVPRRGRPRYSFKFRRDREHEPSEARARAKCLVLPKLVPETFT
uniref:Uncharacterized protein n=1 Tax=Leersia perrieri TaxID=77586 RepID=A0A0D9UX55_9ORYZ